MLSKNRSVTFEKQYKITQLDSTCIRILLNAIYSLTRDASILTRHLVCTIRQFQLLVIIARV